jgi:hypothetical protein
MKQKRRVLDPSNPKQQKFPAPRSPLRAPNRGAGGGKVKVGAQR